MKTLLAILILFNVSFCQILTEIDNQLIHLKGTVGVSVTGAGVSTWADQSGNGNDATQGTDADRPNYVSNSYLDFDSSNTEYLTFGDDNSFTFGDGSSTDSPFSVILYVNMDNATNFVFLSKIASSSLAEYLMYCPSDAPNFVLYDDASGNQDKEIADDVITAYEGQWISVAFTYDGSGTLLIYVNGSAVATTAGSVGTYVAMHNEACNLDLGFIDITNVYSNGKFKEFIMTTDVLTPTEISNLHTYFTTGSWPSDDQSGFGKFYNPGWGGW